MTSQTTNRTVAILLTLAVGPTLASAQGVFKFRLVPGMKLEYDSQFTATIETRVENQQLKSTSLVAQRRHWHVVSVDSLGVATLELTLLKLKVENTDFKGQRIKFDSADKFDADPQLAAQLGKLVGAPIRRVQLGANGVLKATQNLSDQKSHFPDLPFAVTVPDEYPRQGLRWQRDYAITLDAPLGKGEAHKASQVCEVEQLADKHMVVGYETKLEGDPSPADMVALVQFIPRGKVTLDLARGLMLKSESVVDRKLDNVAGLGTYYLYQSKAIETLIDAPVAQARKN